TGGVQVAGGRAGLFNVYPYCGAFASARVGIHRSNAKVTRKLPAQLPTCVARARLRPVARTCAVRAFPRVVAHAESDAHASSLNSTAQRWPPRKRRPTLTSRLPRRERPSP